MEECKVLDESAGFLPVGLTREANHQIHRYDRFDDILYDVHNYAALHNVTNIDYAYPLDDDISFTLLELVVDFGNISIIKELFARGANPNLQDEDGMTPLHLAISHNKSIEVIKCLLDHGADMNIENSNGVSAFSLLCLRYSREALVNIISSQVLVTRTG